MANISLDDYIQKTGINRSSSKGITGINRVNELNITTLQHKTSNRGTPLPGSNVKTDMRNKLRQKMNKPSDARLLLKDKAPVSDARLKLRQKRFETFSRSSQEFIASSAQLRNTSLIQGLSTNAITGKTAGKQIRVPNLTRTINNEADTEMVQGVLKRTLNTKVSSDSVLIVEDRNDVSPSILSRSLQFPKQNQYFEGITTQPKRPKLIPRNDKYHYVRPQPSANDPPQGVTEVSRLLSKTPSTSAETFTIDDHDDEYDDNDDFKSLRFTVSNAVNQPPPGDIITRHSTKYQELSGPLKLYRPTRDEFLTSHIANITATDGNKVKFGRLSPTSEETTEINVLGHRSASESLQSADDKDILSPLQGYRITVTNLHPAVTQDDIIELFGSIGKLKKGQLIKAGVAHVVFNNKESAINAVRKFHNRELDGQPMQVKLLTSLTSMTSYNGGEMSDEVKALIAKSEKNEISFPTPDVNSALINRALFKTGPALNNKPVTFTVKI